MNYLKVIDKQLRLVAITTPFNKATIIATNAIMSVLLKTIRDTKNIKTTNVSINGYEQKPVNAEIFEPKNAKGNLPCMLCIHGGSFCYSAVNSQKIYAMKYAQLANCKVVFPNYKLAPKYKFPAGLQDCIAYYKWIHENSESLGIDKSKIGIAGDSAGGNFAAIITNLCKRENLPSPCMQMLIYPVTDASMGTQSMKKYKFSPIWNSYNSVKMYKYYVPNLDTTIEEISPLNSKFESVIPPTYIETAEYDCLHDEGILYAQKLKKLGAKVSLNDTKATFHGYDAMFSADVSKESLQKRVKFLNECFKEVKVI